jgi:hypothetical protein
VEFFFCAVALTVTLNVTLLMLEMQHIFS